MMFNCWPLRMNAPPRVCHATPLINATVYTCGMITDFTPYTSIVQPVIHAICVIVVVVVVFVVVVSALQCGSYCNEYIHATATPYYMLSSLSVSKYCRDSKPMCVLSLRRKSNRPSHCGALSPRQAWFALCRIRCPMPRSQMSSSRLAVLVPVSSTR